MYADAGTARGKPAPGVGIHGSTSLHTRLHPIHAQFFKNHPEATQRSSSRPRQKRRHQAPRYAQNGQDQDVTEGVQVRAKPYAPVPQGTGGNR